MSTEAANIKSKTIADPPKKKNKVLVNKMQVASTSSTQEVHDDAVIQLRYQDQAIEDVPILNFSQMQHSTCKNSVICIICFIDPHACYIFLCNNFSF